MRRSCTVVALVALATARPAGASDLVGPESCRACHAEAYRIWSASAHARATNSLTAEQHKQPLCLQCHSRDELRAGTAAQVTGVSCETCHGGGRYYQPPVVMRDRELAQLFGLIPQSAATCLACHGGDAPSLKPFDFKEGMARIDHWSKDRVEREKKVESRGSKDERSWSASGSRPGSASGSRPGSASGSRPGSGSGARSGSVSWSRSRAVAPLASWLQGRQQ